MAKKKKKSSKSKADRMEHTSEQFLVGLMIGGGAAYVLSDEALRGQVIRYVMQTYGSVARSVQELKEQFADVQAEVVAEQAVQA